MNKKEEILTKARKLFNAEGYHNSSLRQLALSLDMSLGNLQYHFKAKMDLFEALYFELVDKLNDEIQEMSQVSSLLSLVYKSSETSMQLFYEYRFILRDMYLIFRTNDKIKQHFQDLQEQRKAQFRLLFKTMIQCDILRKETFPKEYDRLYERMHIMGDNWINMFEITKNPVSEPVQYYHRLLFETLFPYMTSTGKEQYEQIVSHC